MWTTLHLLGLEQRPVLDRLLSDVRPLGAGQAGWPSSVGYARSKHMGDMGNASVTFGVSRVSIRADRASAVQAANRRGKMVRSVSLSSDEGRHAAPPSGPLTAVCPWS